MIRLPAEVTVFAVEGGYTIGIGIVYWFISYEVAGTLLLIAMGIGTGSAAVILGRRARRQMTQVRQAGPLVPDGPFGDESGRIPSPGVAPIGVAAGVAIIGLGVAFGPWFLFVGIAIAVLAGSAWIRAAMRELDATERADRAAESEA